MAKPVKAPIETILAPAFTSTAEPRPMTTTAMTQLETYARNSRVPEVEASDSLLSSLSAMVDRAMQLEADLEALEDLRQQRSAKLRELVEDLIPAALDESGVADFTTSTGLKVAVESVVTATLGKGKDESTGAHEQRVQHALAWLDAKGHDGIVKVAFDVNLARGDRAADRKLCVALDSLGIKYKRNEGVHHATLAAFVREQLANGDTVPLDLFRVAQHRRAKIKAPKGT